MMWLRTRLFADSGLLRRRGAALVLALVIELLLALLLFFLAPPMPGRKLGERTNVFGIEASKGEDSPDKKPAEKRQKKAARAQTAQARTQPPPPPVPLPMQTPAPVGPPNFLKLSRNDYQQGDIARMPSRAPDTDSADDEVADAGGGGGAGDTPAVGRGRHGETLYAAEWVRQPTNTELNTYLDRSRARYPGYGLIACRTVARNRVEDCYELGETPGTRFAGTVRQAAFQFLVHPPRLNHKYMVGAWVKIRIDYYEEGRFVGS
ncbi:hypothetical protein P6144_07725 [Sphingomonas sp. HITSZ_GF]|uniref:hypothetical protein n=1 Tax=Sphingomonas sp. HITSZ_GF TaxID=3037247 RepID=UPI00240CEB7D|nr:hypothetical protein [Sphingomonas sp. HITSZ_GF]MDG2533529.1 hypothetical protein [Sphingomonas sp. HITSZ_GF]